MVLVPAFFVLLLAIVTLISPPAKIVLPAGFIDIAERSPPKEVKAPLIALNRAVPSSSSIEYRNPSVRFWAESMPPTKQNPISIIFFFIFLYL